MNRYALTVKPLVAAIVLGACSTTPDMPKDAWKIAPVQTVRHSGPTAAGFYALGRVKEAQGATVQAIDAYRKAVAADPSHAASWNALGALQMQLGRTDEGLQALERAVSLSPTASHLHNNLGYALLLAGRDDDAVKTLQRAVELDGANRRAWANLATAYRRLGALDQAEFADAHASVRRATVASQTPPTAIAPPAAVTRSDLRIATDSSASHGPAPATALVAPDQVKAVTTVRSVEATLTLSADPLPALAKPEPAPPAKTGESAPVATLEASTVALGFVPPAPTRLTAAASPSVTTTPSTTIVKVAENVFELRNGPATRGATIAEAVAIIAATAPPAPAIAAAPRAVETSPAMKAPSTPLASPPPAARYEISNGHGGEGLARRLAGLLSQQGVARPRLTNQAPYNQAASVIQYRDGYRASAEAFASQLPFRPQISATSTASLVVDVRLVLGRDLTTSDACAVLGLCARVARAPAPKVAAAGHRSD